MRGKEDFTNDVENNGLYDALAAYGKSDYYPYHMPGHKRNPEAGVMGQYYDIDITEIDGFDNLHHAEGILLEAQRRANRLYGNEETETFYLINGSTCGILAAVMASAGRGEDILIARNCHKSVYHATILQELRPHYYYPPVMENYGICGGVGAEDIACLLERYPACRAVVITSPTYEGILSDVRAVAEVVHEYDKILIVDEAHGAHLGLHLRGAQKVDSGAYGTMPPGALSQSADLVIHSLHKTLPAMTQTALLHVQGDRVDREKLRRYLTMLQTSSPSYILMASMDSCIRYVEKHGAGLYLLMCRQYERFCDRMKQCRYIRIGNMEEKTHIYEKYHMAGWDIGKILISVQDNLLNGRQLYDLLRDEFHLQMEMAAEKYVLAIMTLMDTQEGWQRLADALEQIDDRIDRDGHCSAGTLVPAYKTEEMQQEKVRKTGSLSLADAFLGEREEIPLTESAGRLAADFINLYPPGIPLMVPGEMVSEDFVERIQKSMQMGLDVQGVTPDGAMAVVAHRPSADQLKAE